MSDIVRDYDIRKVDGDEMSMSWPSNSSYDEVETGVFIKGTTAYPEDGYSVTHFVHVCPDCFRTKLITLLEANGIKFNKVDRDW